MRGDRRKDGLDRPAPALIAMIVVLTGDRQQINDPGSYLPKCFSEVWKHLRQLSHDTAFKRGVVGNDGALVATAQDLDKTFCQAAPGIIAVKRQEPCMDQLAVRRFDVA